MQMCPFCDKVYDESEYSHCRADVFDTVGGIAVCEGKAESFE